MVKQARKSTIPLPRVVFIGAGNVATHLAPAFEAAGVGEVIQVYSRTLRSASALASKLWEAEATDSMDDIRQDADIYVVSLADHAAAGVISSLKPNRALWLHTSGSLPIDVLDPLSRKTGVFYPLQTFSKRAQLDISEVPLFIEGSTPGVEAQIREIGEKIFANVRHADSDLRRKMHVAAVFACNFTNHLWTIADDLLRQEGLTLEVLHPLMKETMRKAIASESPADGQTGPAVRGDRAVMDKHMSMLDSDMGQIYSLLSESIEKRHKK